MSDIQTEQDAYWAGLRRAGRFNISRRFPYAGIREGDPLAGRASRFAYTVVDSDTDTEFSSEEGWELVLRETPTRQQLKVLFFEDSRQIMQVAFQRFRNGVRIERECFTLRDEEITQMFGFFELLQSRGLLIEEDGEGFRFSPELARQVLEDGAALSNFARTHPEVLQTIIQSEISAPDVIALAHRKNVLEQLTSCYMMKVLSNLRNRQLADLKTLGNRSSKTILGLSVAPSRHSFSTPLNRIA